MENTTGNADSKHTQSIETKMHSSYQQLSLDLPREIFACMNAQQSESLDKSEADLIAEEVESCRNLLLARIDLSSLECVSLEQREKLPNVPGIYFVLEDEQVIYIGRSQKSILRRWWNHQKLKALNVRKGKIKIAWFECRAVDLLPLIESTLIGYFEPELNYTVGEGILRYYKHKRQLLEEADSIIGKRVELRRTDWLLVEEVAAKLKLSINESLMWVIRLGYPDTVRRYKRMMRRLEAQLKQS